VLVRGPSMMSGYDGLPEATAAAMSGEWLDTGDLGFLWDGELYVHGRVKDVIIARGRKHAAHRVEAWLGGVEGVRGGCSAAFGVVQSDGEELVVLFERARSGGEGAELVERVRRRIVEGVGVAPAHVSALAPGTLPRTSSGKIRRAEARRQYLA